LITVLHKWLWTPVWEKSPDTPPRERPKYISLTPHPQIKYIINLDKNEDEEEYSVFGLFNGNQIQKIATGKNTHECTRVAEWHIYSLLAQELPAYNLPQRVNHEVNF
jgi:hypothetical protein